MTEFSGKISQQEWMVSPETQKLMTALLEDGGDARFVGGCVRNTIVNRKVFDIDIATPLKPEEVIERLKRHQIHYVPTGLKHGTVTAVVDGHPFEITTLRLDVTTDGRHAEVLFTDDWTADAARRDFTMNAIFSNLNGDLFDPFGGVADLRQGIVKFVGIASQRIEEDVLRILRYFRFYAHFGRGEPDAEAIKACAAGAPQIPKLSAERIRQETLKLLESDQCARIWQLMIDYHIVDYFLPEAKNIQQLEKLISLETSLHNTAFSLRRLAVVTGVTAEGAKSLAIKLRLSNDQAEQLAKMTQVEASTYLQMTDADVKKMVYRFGHDMARNMILVAASRTEEDGRFNKMYQLATTFRPPRFPMMGEDVLKAGYPSGPEVGHILHSIEEWWMENDFAPGRTECLELLNKQFKP